MKNYCSFSSDENDDADEFLLHYTLVKIVNVHSVYLIFHYSFLMCQRKSMKHLTSHLLFSDLRFSHQNDWNQFSSSDPNHHPCISYFLAFMYSIPIIFIRRFHHINNIFTVNLCCATICCCVCWLSIYIISLFYPDRISGDRICLVLNYFQIRCTLQVPLAAVETSVHRLCSIVYHTKPFFRQKRWAVICIVCQWTTGFILPLLRILFENSVRILNSYWKEKNDLFPGLHNSGLGGCLRIIDYHSHSIVDMFDEQYHHL